MNLLRIDPTRTVTLRRQFLVKLRKIFAKLKFQINELLVKENALGVNTRWKFYPSPEKIQAFEAWLRAQFVNVADVWKAFINAGFQKGASRAFDDVRKRKPEEKLDFYAGTREEFLRSSFANPASNDALRVLVGRSLTEYKGITEEMSTRMVRILAEGLTRGENPRIVAKNMARQLDMSFRKASTIARTELIRAHAEGQLQAMRKLGVQDLNVMVEWSTAGDSRVCPLCKPMDGVTFSIDEASGLIPYHPNCRCAWVPAIV